MIRIIFDGQPLEVTWQRKSTRSKFSAALLEHPSPHVLESERGGIDLVDMFGLGNRVHDVDRYRVSQTAICQLDPHRTGLVAAEHNTFKDIHIDAEEAPRFTETVVVVLESPHREEYVDGDVNCPIAPAQGVTGCNIDRWLPHVLKADAITEAGLQLANDSRVIIANPVQFQASLACIHGGRLEFEGKRLNWRKLRNEVWKVLWDQQKEENFSARLCVYKPELILNCCTAELQPEVTRWLHSKNYGSITFCTDHPSAWRIPLVTRCGEAIDQ